MRLPKRRIIWIVVAIAGVVSLSVADSTIDANNIVHDSALMPVGAILLLVAFLIFVFDAIKTAIRG
ncbi:hypothetical protein M979_0328 [Buttiauxella noackiae ATCC 51607]|uniref:Inner membrane protein n=1 Tax=Buttiauxella noackiae ATCC 51607 TaxID=1354255 RepID=A0A1B7HZL7_9ENTR|nr:hypothetical protein [Buttiauxella noackiae]OAT21099.1 hypothetical protein M979_0328 [Buttiauxella noackiae ATCC 51607]